MIFLGVNCDETVVALINGGEMMPPNAHPIERYRRVNGWTQAELAKRVGVTPNAVHAWENGAEPRASRLPKLAEVLGLPPLQLQDEISAWRPTTATNG